MIEAIDLGKRYFTGQRESYFSLRDSLGGLFSKKPIREEFWALKNINFTVKEGDSVGIVGRNGAGKSTLLKILSRVTPPTRGTVRMLGRVASLLEVGTGFNPELTGRENIYLNGAILGMRQSEIRNKFDEIVAFSEVEKFLDTPVKHYSSGMYMRLAFAVAAHLESEILIVDEVLAVGDLQFQKKCIGKMKEVSQKSGKTLLFVSHNLGTVSELCNRAIWLDKGELRMSGKTNEIVSGYIKSLEKQTEITLSERTDRTGSGETRFVRCDINKGKPVVGGARAEIDLEYKSEHRGELRNCRLGITIKNMLGQVLFLCASEVGRNDGFDLPPTGVLRCHIDELPLTAGDYYLDIFLEVDNVIEDMITDAVLMRVDSCRFFSGLKQVPVGFDGKFTLVKNKWEVLRG